MSAEDRVAWTGGRGGGSNGTTWASDLLRAPNTGDSWKSMNRGYQEFHYKNNKQLIFFKEENQMCLYDINTSFGIQVWINSKLKCELTFLWPKSTLYLLGSMPALLKSFSPNFVSATNEIPNIWKQNSFKYIKQDRKV